MATYRGGTAVKRGYYIDGTSFEFTTVERDGSALPGGPELFDVVAQVLGQHHVAHDQAGLGGQVPDQPLLRRRDLVTRFLLDR